MAETETETTPLLLPAGAGVTGIVDPAVARPPPGDQQETENPNRPTGLRFAIVYISILLGDFFVGYDTSCVTTLTPVISDEFHSIGDVGWYGISYVLALVSTVLIFGQLYNTFPIKATFTMSFLIFGIGSTISSLATSSAVFILGRAVTGIGGAGIFSGGTIVISKITPLHNRPIYQGLSGGVECISMAFGAPLSGAIAHITSSWRYSFLIIAPACFANVLAITMFVHSLPHDPKGDSLSAKGLWSRIDIGGILLFVPCTVCFILALQWGGSAYAWDDTLIIALLTATVILLAFFFMVQKHKGDMAMLPLHLLRERSVALGSLGMFFVSGSAFVFGFFLPIYFQAVRGADTMTSGIMYLPSAVSASVATLVGGHITSYIGYYTPVMAVGTLIMSTGAGLMIGFTRYTPPAQWITYQILHMFGTGILFQQPYTAVQTILPEKHIATSLVLLVFVQELGGIVALAIAQNIFISRLLGRLQGLGLGLQPSDVLEQGALDLIEMIPEGLRPIVYTAYMKTLQEVFILGCVLACLTAVSLGIPWRSVKEKKDITAD